jgi:hypothetical protein
MANVGYSGTPLAKKLGFKEGYTICIINQPSYYNDLFEALPPHIKFTTDHKVKKNIIHYFALTANALDRDLIALKNEIVPDGMIWISWPKKSSKVATDVTEDFIRNLALSNGLVDVKVCAVDEVWSALKLVIPVKDRK